MKVYWDSSALVAALNGEPGALESLAKDQERCTRIHTFSECFSQLTGGRLGRRFSPTDAARMIREGTKNFQIIELSVEESLSALEQAGPAGVRGGIIHDFLHVVAARKAGAQHICTHNDSDFRMFTDLPLGLF